MSHSFDPVARLATVVVEERDRIARLWSKRLKLELHELEVRSRDLREPLLGMVSELGRLLRDRGEEALRLWPECVRIHGAERYELRYDADDVARELKALHYVLLRVYVKRHGGLEPEVAELVAELMGEASAAMQASFARVLRAEEVRLRETAVMQSLLEHIDVGVVLAEADGRLSYATPPVSRLLGIPARALVGAGTDALRALLLQLHARHLDGEPFRAHDLPHLRALADGREIRGAAMVVDRMSDQKEMILELHALPVMEEGSSDLYGVVMTLADRTETTHKARELRQAYDQLRRLQGRLMQRTRAQALGQLASGAAHNLNNFLNVIRLRVTLLRRGFKPEYLDALDRTVGNIGELVARLQDFAEASGGDEVDCAHLNTLVREGLELARPELEREGPELTLSTALEGDPTGMVDPVSLRELVANLALWCRGRARPGATLRVSSHTDAGWLHLRIEHEGGAYDADELVRLFDPLKGKTAAPQLALLLAVGRGQVQRWGGELWAENLPEGAGAAFRLRLPLAAEAREESEAPRPPRPQIEASTVLVVDDEPENARIMAQVLTDEGYEVRVAHSGDQAVAMWESGHFDAALLDAVMPDQSGWSVAREIRRRTPTALIAMVTGADVRGQNRENLALVDAVFRKPVDVEALDEFLTRAGRSPQEGHLPPSTVH
jgi:two-component system cell cycle sensor histidine kinase/response regulator CckA